MNTYDFSVIREHPQVTDEGIERMRARIGVEIPRRSLYNEVATLDAIRHFVHGIGDDNPLFCDEDYGRNSRWGSVIAPSTFVQTMGVSRTKEIPPDVRERGRGALTGVHGWYSGLDMEFFLPIYIGDRLTVREYLADVQVKESEFARRTVHTIYRMEWANQRGELVAIADRLIIAGGREKTRGERKKYADITRQSYTQEDIASIEAHYEKEERRGATPRYWDDVAIGEEIPSIVKGPLTISDIMAYLMGHGSPYIRAHKLAYEYRKRHPAAYVLNQYGIPDIAERVHWEDALALQTGNPAAYDYAGLRVCSLCQLMTNWMGDDGWLRHVHIELRRFNYIGDTTWCKGKVTRKYRDDMHSLVESQIWCEDQRGRQTATGSALVALPSRERGPVELRVLPFAPLFSCLPRFSKEPSWRA